MTIIKKTNCKTCGFFDGTFCRIGCGWAIPKPCCKEYYRIRDNRCGTCKYFSMTGGDRNTGKCTRRKYTINDFRNFYNSCDEYTHKAGKDLKPLPETPPEWIWTEKKKY